MNQCVDDSAKRLWPLVTAGQHEIRLVPQQNSNRGGKGRSKPKIPHINGPNGFVTVGNKIKKWVNRLIAFAVAEAKNA
jgi:hypothetical protein